MRDSNDPCRLPEVQAYTRPLLPRPRSDFAWRERVRNTPRQRWTAALVAIKQEMNAKRYQDRRWPS